MSLFPEPEFKEAEDKPPTYRDLLYAEIAYSKGTEFLDEDAGDYGYEGWVSIPAPDYGAITDYVIEKLQEFAKQKGVSFP